MASQDWDDLRLRFLLDEMISPRVAPQLAGMNVDAVPVLHRGRKGQSDYAIWKLAQNEEMALVTINQKDFEKLASGYNHHNGLVVIPGDGSRAQQFAYIAAAAAYAREKAEAMTAFLDTMVSVDHALRVSARTVCSEQDDTIISLPTIA